MKIAVLAWVLAAATSAQAAPLALAANVTSFTSGKSVVGAVSFEAAGRKGSKRVGGSGRSGKGGHYVGGRK